MNYSNNSNEGRTAYPKNRDEVDGFVLKQLQELRVFVDEPYPWIDMWAIKMGYEGRGDLIDETMQYSGERVGAHNDWDPDYLGAWVDEFLEYHRQGYTWVEIDGELEADAMDGHNLSLARDLMDQTAGRCIATRFRVECEMADPLRTNIVEKLGEPVRPNIFVRELPLLGFELREDAIKFKLSWTY
jgi:hypothetical protein